MPIQSNTALQNWLWQSESWVIWTDGQSLPVFYDGNTARKSLGGSLVNLGSTSAFFAIPAQNQYVTVNLSENFTGNLGPVLINAALYDVVGITSKGTGSVSQLSLAGIIYNQLGGTDLIAPGTAILLNSKYLGMIEDATDANGNSISAFPPLAVAGVAGTAFTIPVSGLSLFDSAKILAQGMALVNASNTYAVAQVGMTITVNNQSCVISSLVSNSSFYVTSLTCTPSASSATGINIAGTVNIPSITWQYYTYVGSSKVIASGSSASGSFTETTPGTMNGGTTANANYFYLTLTQVNSVTVGNILQFGTSATNGLCTFKVISVNGNVVECQMVTLPSGTYTMIPIGTPEINQIVVNTSNTSPATTSVGYYGTTTDGAIVTTTSQSVAATIANMPYTPNTSGTQAAVEQLVQITATNGSVDLFLVTSCINATTTTTPSITVINLNDTPGASNTGTTTDVLTPNGYPAGVAIYSLPEIYEAARMGCYAAGRNWFSTQAGNGFIAGDIVGSSSGTPTGYRDAVLKVSQNYFLAGGGTFSIPGSGEKITAMALVAQLDASLGQGPVQVFTDDTVFTCNAPPDMSTWANLNYPILTESLIGSGAIAQDAVVQTNGDLLFRLSDGGVQSLLMARLDFNRWGNTPISKEVSRSTDNDPPTLLPWTSMAVFNNRMLMTCKLAQMSRGVAGKAMVALNYDPISSLGGKSPPVWDGEWVGLNVLQIITGMFNGSKQCYALCLSDNTSAATIQLVQIPLDASWSGGGPAPAQLDNGLTPVSFTIETPMVFSQKGDVFKRLVNGEMWIRDIQPQGATVQAFYRVDQNTAWTPWATTSVGYQPNDSGFRPRIGLGEPAANVYDASNNRPMREGYDFQVKLVLSGCTLLRARFAAVALDQPEFAPAKNQN
jgi:hypothetical protein